MKDYQIIQLALALLVVLSLAWLAGCGSATGDEANVRTKPVTAKEE